MTQKEPRITYLLGAGASYNALPIVKEIPNQARLMLEYLIKYSNVNKFNDVRLDKSRHLINQIDKHYSVDTLARKFWLRDKGDFTSDDYVRLKNIITCLIIFCQIENWEVKPGLGAPVRLGHRESPVFALDTRYDAFFSAILKQDLSIPENINLISWNYDFQLEKVFNFYHNEKSIWEIGGDVLGIDYQANRSNSQVLKVNGTALFVSGINPKIDYTFYNKELHDVFIRALSDELDTNLLSGIKFAWEPSELTARKREQASTVIQNSDFVVVIGYSFPIFNRDVDIKMFKDFRGKLVIQDLDGRAQDIQQQLGAIKKGLITNSGITTNLDNFYVPTEYWSGQQPRYQMKVISF
jgi:hypothetical protein